MGGLSSPIFFVRYYSKIEPFNLCRRQAQYYMDIKRFMCDFCLRTCAKHVRECRQMLGIFTPCSDRI